MRPSSRLECLLVVSPQSPPGAVHDAEQAPTAPPGRSARWWRRLRDPVAASQAGRADCLLPRWFALGSVGVYLVLRILAFRHGARVWTDTGSYLEQARLPLFSERFVAGARSLTVPLIWRLLPGGFDVIIGTQLVLSVCCWLFLAFEAARVPTRRWARMLVFWSVLALSLGDSVAQWDNQLLSESLALTLTALLVALALRAVRKPSVPHVVAALLVGFLWAFARDSNAYAAVAVVPVLALVLLARGRSIRRRNIFLLAGALVGVCAIFAASYESAAAGDRAHWPVIDIIAFRLSADPEAMRWMRAHGYVSPSAPNTVAIYRDYLFSHPLGTLEGPLLNPRDPVMPHEKRLYALYTPFVARYDQGARWWTLPPLLQKLIHPLHPRFVLSVFAVVLLLASALALAGRATRLWLVFGVLALSVYPQEVVVWNGSGREIDRHALIPAICLDLALVVLAVLCIEQIAELALAKRVSRAALTRSGT
jgi:hypothetical protein